MELSKYLRDYSRTVAGKEQLIIAAVAKSLEVIPRQLCDNAGFDSTNILNRLRQAHAQGKAQSLHGIKAHTHFGRIALDCIHVMESLNVLVDEDSEVSNGVSFSFR